MYDGAMVLFIQCRPFYSSLVITSIFYALGSIYF